MGVDRTAEEGSRETEKAGRRFRPGDIVSSSYQPPSKPREGLEWVPVARHNEKGYPTKWRLEDKRQTEPPAVDEVPPTDPKTGEPINPEGPTDEERINFVRQRGKGPMRFTADKDAPDD